MDTFRITLTEAGKLARLNNFQNAGEMAKALSKFFRVEIVLADGRPYLAFMNGICLNVPTPAVELTDWIEERM